MISNIKYSMNMKLIFVGDPSVGKTSLLHRLLHNEYKEDTISTMGVDFVFKNFEINDSTVKLQIWDTAGQERFRSLINSYYRHSQGIIMVFDLTDEQSFNNMIDQWVPVMVANLGTTIPKILVLGNKVDLDSQRLALFEKTHIKSKIEQIPEACFRDLDLNDCFHHLDDPQAISYKFNGGESILAGYFKPGRTNPRLGAGPAQRRNERRARSGGAHI